MPGIQAAVELTADGPGGVTTPSAPARPPAPLRKPIVTRASLLLAILAAAVASSAWAAQGDPIPGADVSAEQSPDGIVIARLPSGFTGPLRLRAQAGDYLIKVGPIPAAPRQPASATISVKVQETQVAVRNLALPTRATTVVPLKLTSPGVVTVSITYGPAG